MPGVTSTHRRLTYDELSRWPDDGRRYELYDGEVFVVPSPLPLHQIAAARLYLALEGYVREHGGIVLFAPLDIVLTDYDCVQPDILMFTAERVHLIDPRKVTRYPPDLAIEILSSSTSRNDRGRKRQLLARHGVREYWLVDPEEPAVEVFALESRDLVLVDAAAGDARVGSRLLPDLAIRPDSLVP